MKSTLRSDILSVDVDWGGDICVEDTGVNDEESLGVQTGEVMSGVAGSCFCCESSLVRPDA